MAKEATRNAYGKALAELVVERDDVLVLDADLTKSTKTIDAKKARPEHHFLWSDLLVQIQKPSFSPFLLMGIKHTFCKITCFHQTETQNHCICHHTKQCGMYVI